MPFIFLPVAPFLLTSFSDERSKAPRQDAGKSPTSTVATFSVPFWSLKKEHRQRLDAVHPVDSLSTVAPFLLTSFGDERSKAHGNLPLLVLEPYRQHQINEILAFLRQHLHRA